MDFLVGSPIMELQEIGEKARGSQGESPRAIEVGYACSASTARCSVMANQSGSKQGERVLFHVLNGSATEIRSLALPGQLFRVVALDGNPVPTQRSARAMARDRRTDVRHRRDETSGSLGTR